MIPSAQFAQQDDPDAGAALIAKIAAGSVLIIEPKSVFPAADRAWAVLVDQEPVPDPELQQNVAPLPACTLDGAAHAAPRCMALAYAICRERTQARTAASGGSGSGSAQGLDAGKVPNRSLYFIAAHPGL